MFSHGHPLSEDSIVNAAQNRGVKFAYFILGIALPIAGFIVWNKTDGFRCFGRKSHIDKMRDITEEDSFPASDPPSTW
jgi:hypothetical protein